MAKRKTPEPSTPVRETRSSARAAVRATRSATRSGNASLTPPVDNPQPRRTKKAKTDGASSSPVAGLSSSPDAAGGPSSTVVGASSSAAAGGPPSTVAGLSSSAAAGGPSSTVAGASSSAAAGGPSSTVAGASSSAASGGSSSAAALARGSCTVPGKTVVIEHCLQTEAFKTKAEQVKKGLERSILGIKVVLNPEAPRKGCFEIRLENGSVVFESLLDVQKPFQAVKALDVKKVVSEIVLKI